MPASSPVASIAGSHARAWAASRSRRRSWQPGGQQPVGLAGGLDLQPGEGPDHLLDHLQGRLPADLLAQVVQHHPAPTGVDGQRGRHPVPEQPGQRAHDRPFVDEQGRGRGRLEPDVAGRRRGPQDARQVPDLDLLHRPGEGPADGGHGVVQPALGPGEPAAGRPGPAGAGRLPGPPAPRPPGRPGRRPRRRRPRPARPARPRPARRAGPAGPGARPAGSPAGPWPRGPRARPGSAAGGRRRRAGRAGRAGPDRARPSRPGPGARSGAGTGPPSRLASSTLASVGWATTQRMLVRQPSSLMDRPYELAGRRRTRISRPARHQPRPADPVHPPGQAGPDAHVADAEDVAERPGGRDREHVPQEGQPRVGQGGRALEPGLGDRQPGRGQGLGRGRHHPAVGGDGEQVAGGAEGDQRHPRDPPVGQEEHRPDGVGGHQQQRAQPVGQPGQPDPEHGQAEGGVDGPDPPEPEVDQGPQPAPGQGHGQRAEHDHGDEEHRPNPTGTDQPPMRRRPPARPLARGRHRDHGPAHPRKRKYRHAATLACWDHAPGEAAVASP